MIEFKKSPNEKGSGTFFGQFKDELKNLVIPKTAKYSVFDVEGNAINGLDKLNIANYTSSWKVSLTGDDLIVPEVCNKVFFTIFITYDSDQGTDREGTEQGVFFINDLVGV